MARANPTPALPGRGAGERAPSAVSLAGGARRERPDFLTRLASVNELVGDEVTSLTSRAAQKEIRDSLPRLLQGSWAGGTSTIWTRIKTMNLRFELKGIALSMPTLKRGRRPGFGMGTDEAVPSKATGSWVKLERRASLCASRIGPHAEQCSALRQEHR
jgi:hypothetical protein